MTDTRGSDDIDKESADSTAPKSTADESETALGPRRSQRKGKKKADPDFVELPIPTKSEVKLELITLSTDEAQDNTVNNVESGSEDNLQNESPGVQEEDDDDNDWEGCPEEKTGIPQRQGRYECKDCSKLFNNKSDLVRHMNLHNGTKPYTCEICGKTFLRSDYLRLHAIKHQGVKPLKCELCDRRFYDRSNLRQHMRTHTGEKPAICPYCPHRCSQLSDMRKHLTTHTKEKAFQCDTCGKTFSLKTGLVAHQRLHTGERPFACGFCDKRFRDHTSMRRHKRIHTGDKPFLCTHCGKTFTQVANMKRHMLTHTSDVKDKLYPCPICGVELASRADVRSHVARDHDQKKTTKLQEQEATVASAANQMQEENERESTNDQAASNEEAHACNLCDKVYVSKANLLDHMRRAHVTNPAAKEHQCETCGKTFCQASSLKAHQLVHTGAKPHTCEVCQVSFRKTHHLRRHMLTHTGERPYHCDFCDRTFTSSGNLNKHRAIHLGEKNFECEVCSKKFTQSSNLSKHRNIHLRQQQQLQSTNGEDCNRLIESENAVTMARKGRGRKKMKEIQFQAMEDAGQSQMIGIVSMTEEEMLIQQEQEAGAEGRAAVLQIVSTEEHHCIEDEHNGTVSYVTLSEGDIIIEI